MPDIDQTIHRPLGDQGVNVYGIHSGEPPDLLADFQEQTGVAFPLVRDNRSTLYQFSFPGGVGYPYPRDVVVDQNLKVRMIRNSFDVDEMEGLVRDLLAHPP